MNKKGIAIIIGVLIIVGISISTYINFKNKNTDHKLQNNNTQSEKENNTSNNENSNSNGDSDHMSDNKKIAVVYFSATNTTKTVAEYIRDVTNGDLIEIVPKEKYTSNDLNYGNANSRANKEQNDSSTRPEIANTIDVTSYDTIYLGYPIWWGDVPKIILTFLDTYNLSGKTVIPFCTSHSSGISGSLSTLNNYNKNINWKEGKRFSTNSKNEINSWISEVNK